MTQRKQEEQKDTIFCSTQTAACRKWSPFTSACALCHMSAWFYHTQNNSKSRVRPLITHIQDVCLVRKGNSNECSKREMRRKCGDGSSPMKFGCGGQCRYFTSDYAQMPAGSRLVERNIDCTDFTKSFWCGLFFCLEVNEAWGQDSWLRSSVVLSFGMQAWCAFCWTTFVMHEEPRSWMSRPNFWQWGKRWIVIPWTTTKRHSRGFVWSDLARRMKCYFSKAARLRKETTSSVQVSSFPFRSRVGLCPLQALVVSCANENKTEDSARTRCKLGFARNWMRSNDKLGARPLNVHQANYLLRMHRNPISGYKAEV